MPFRGRLRYGVNCCYSNSIQCSSVCTCMQTLDLVLLINFSHVIILTESRGRLSAAEQDPNGGTRKGWSVSVVVVMGRGDTCVYMYIHLFCNCRVTTVIIGRFSSTELVWVMVR